jgi:hypothetical protein
MLRLGREPFRLASRVREGANLWELHAQQTYVEGYGRETGILCGG